jgi:hypothetical protein
MKRIVTKTLTGLLSVTLIKSIFLLSIAQAGTDNAHTKRLISASPTIHRAEDPADEMKKNPGVVSGQVVSQESEPVSFATVALLSQADSTLISGAITDENGFFEFNDLPLGEYALKVSYLGYKSEVIGNINLTRKSRKVALEPAVMEPDTKQLDEVVFTSERLKGEEKIDRTTFTLNDDLRKVSTTGIDVLKHIPSVQVDFQENVTLEGQSNIQFYVDGVLRNKDYVAQLDPQHIDKVEIISNPGVKYDADVAGVINIVMKKTKRYGVSGSVTVPIPHPTKILANPKANIEYGNNKFRFYGGTRIHMERFNGSESLYTETDESYVQPFKFYKESEGEIGWMNGYTNYGIDWFLSENTTLNFLGEWRKGKGINNDYLSNNRRYENGDLTQYFTSNLNGSDNRDNHYLSLFLKQQMPGEGSELTAEAYVYLHNSDARNRYEDIYYDPEDMQTILEEVNRQDQTLNSSRTAEMRVDYTFQLKNVKNEVGARYYNQWMSNDFTDDYNVSGSEGEVFDNFKFTEIRQTGYYNLLGAFKEFKWQLGFRGEYSQLDINDTVMKDYFVFLPQVSVSRSFGEGNNVKLSFRRQIHRPSVHSLNPFTTWTDSLHVWTGNPDLDPALENKIELSYARNFKNNYISPKFYLRYTKDNIQDLSIINEEGITEITQANIGKDLEYGIGVNAAIQVLKRWRVNGNFALYNRVVGSEHALSRDEDNQKVSYRAGLTNIVMLPKEFAVFAFAYYNSPYVTYQREHSRDLLVIFGAEKTLWKKAKVEFFYNPFIKDFTYAEVKTRTQDYYEHWRGHLDVHHIYAIEFTYNFNYGGKIKKSNRRADYEVDEGGGTF